MVCDHVDATRTRLACDRVREPVSRAHLDANDTESVLEAVLYLSCRFVSERDRDDSFGVDPALDKIGNPVREKERLTGSSPSNDLVVLVVSNDRFLLVFVEIVSRLVDVRNEMCVPLEFLLDELVVVTPHSFRYRL